MLKQFIMSKSYMKRMIASQSCYSKLPPQGNVVAFALLMTPFATNPLIYVASDRNYRRLAPNLLQIYEADVGLAFIKNFYIYKT